MSKPKKINKILNIYKPLGVSPLDAIKSFQEKNPEYGETPITYAGRLDPMAEGVLVLLAGEAVHEKNKYLKLDKEYIAEILFGFETDTYDILGMATSKEVLDKLHQRLPLMLFETLKDFRGEIVLPLPPYCSYKIKGKPLFQWAREGRLGEIKIPKRKMTIHKIEFLDSYKIKSGELEKIIAGKINTVKGDFRQKEILENWQKILENNGEYSVAKVKVHCSSGTYVRSIVHHLGKKLKTGAVLFSLTRTKVGDFDIKDSVRI